MPYELSAVKNVGKSAAFGVKIGPRSRGSDQVHRHRRGDSAIGETVTTGTLGKLEKLRAQVTPAVASITSHPVA
jgi:hypothetical protein